VLVTEPAGVVTLMRPDVAPKETVVTSFIAVEEVTPAFATLVFTLLFATVVEKLVPLMVTAVPYEAIVGVKEEMVGAPAGAAIVKFVLLVAVPVGVVTVMAPVVAPVGTLVTICVLVADTTVAVVLLKRTVF
jgi:hypothetical protein